MAEPQHSADTGPGPGNYRLAERRTVLIRAAFLSALALLAGIGTLSYYVVHGNAERVGWVDHTYEVIRATNKLIMDHKDAAAAARGYMLTGDNLFVDPYHAAAGAIFADLDRLATLIQDNPAEVKRVVELRTASASRLASLDKMLDEQHPPASLLGAALTAQLLQSKRSMDDLSDITDAMVAEEDRLLTDRRDHAARSGLRAQWVMVIGDSVSLVVLLCCLWLLTSELRSRRRAEARARLLNASLTEHNALLEFSNRELEGFSYSISHDLRSPLRAIDGFSELLERRYAGQMDAEGLRLLGVVRDSSRRMAVLIDDLLEFSRLGRRPLQLGDVEMRPLVEECLAEVLRDNPWRPVISLGELPPCRGDRSLLRQACVNLIGNAVKYSSRNPAARIEVAGRREQGENIYSVRDNGVGFDMQYYDKLFGVFQRLHAEEDFPGTGVGLAIAMRIITKHGGRMWADAALGKGATFHFSLPSQEGRR